MCKLTEVCKMTDRKPYESNTELNKQRKERKRDGVDSAETKGTLVDVFNKHDTGKVANYNSPSRNLIEKELAEVRSLRSRGYSRLEISPSRRAHDREQDLEISRFSPQTSVTGVAEDFQRDRKNVERSCTEEVEEKENSSRKHTNRMAERSKGARPSSLSSMAIQSVDSFPGWGTVATVAAVVVFVAIAAHRVFKRR